MQIRDRPYLKNNLYSKVCQKILRFKLEIILQMIDFVKYHF